MKPKNKGGVV